MPDEMNIQGSSGAFDRRWLIGGLAIAALILAGLIAWLILKPSPSTNQPSPNQSANLPSAANQNEISWQTYTNQKYGYSLNYPQGWFLDTTYAEKDFSTQADASANVGGEIMLSNKENPGDQISSGNLSSDLITMSVTVYKVDVKTTADQFIKNKKYSTPLNQANITYAGLGGKQLLYDLSRPDTKEVLNIVTVLKQDTKIFVFSYNSFKSDKLKLPQEVTTIHDQILKSFQLK